MIPWHDNAPRPSSTERAARRHGRLHPPRRRPADHQHHPVLPDPGRRAGGGAAVGGRNGQTQPAPPSVPAARWFWGCRRLAPVGDGVDLHQGQRRRDDRVRRPPADPAPADFVELGSEAGILRIKNRPPRAVCRGPRSGSPADAAAFWSEHALRPGAVDPHASSLRTTLRSVSKSLSRRSVIAASTSLAV